MKILLFVCLFAFSEATPGYSGSSYSGNDIGSGGSAGSGAYGYSGSFSGNGGFPGGNFPGFIPFYDFSSFFDQLNRQHQEFIKKLQSLAEQAQAGGYAGGTYAPGYSGYQGSSIPAYGGATGGSGGSYGGGYGGGYGVGNRGGFVGGYGGGYSGPDGGYSFSGPIGDNGAYASGSIGPGGAHQTAAVYPENPSSPNVNTRFGGSGDGGGFKSVFTSSKSVTSNVNGQPQTYRQASTTINDNGKVTTYTAHNP